MAWIRCIGATGGGGDGYTTIIPLFQDGRDNGNWYLVRANDAKRAFVSFTATDNGTVFVSPGSHAYTNTSGGDGYISIDINGVEITRQQLPQNVDTPFTTMVNVPFETGDIITISGGFDGSHSSCFFYLWGGFAVAYGTHTTEDLLETLITNVYIKSTSPGAQAAYNGWSATPYIPVTPGETLKMAMAVDEGYAAWYNGTGGTAGEYISQFKPAEVGYIEVTVPAGATYFRYSQDDAVLLRTKIWRER